MTTLHETHICRDCGAEITVPYAKSSRDTLDRLMELWQQPWSEPAFGEAQMLIARLRAGSEAAERMRRRAIRAERERDLAVAHDSQPYPTAWAYEQACAAREKWQARAIEAETRLASLTDELA